MAEEGPPETLGAKLVGGLGPDANRSSKLWDLVSRPEAEAFVDGPPGPSVQAAWSTFLAGDPMPEDRALALAGAMALVTVIAPDRTAGQHWMIKQPRRAQARLTVGTTETLTVEREHVLAHVELDPLLRAGWDREVPPWPSEIDAQVDLEDRYFSSLGDDQVCLCLSERAFLWALGNPAFVRAARLTSTRLAIRTNLLQRRNYDAELVERATAPFGGLDAALPIVAASVLPSDDVRDQVTDEPDGSPIGDRPFTSRTEPTGVWGMHSNEATVAGTVAHEEIRQMIHDRLRSAGVAAREGLRGVSVDLVWRRRDGGPVVAEVKSCTETNLTDQLRLGLGQVLEYRYRLRQVGCPVEAVLAVDRVDDETWYDVCADVGVVLVRVDPATGSIEPSLPH